jgi:hypothetical protein
MPYKGLNQQNIEAWNILSANAKREIRYSVRFFDPELFLVSQSDSASYRWTESCTVSCLVPACYW